LQPHLQLHLRERERSPQINKIVFVIFLPSLLKRKEIQALQMHIRKEIQALQMHQ